MDKVVALDTTVIENVAGILQYGFIGLSVVLVIFGYLLFKKCLSIDSVRPEQLSGAKFFLVFSFVFMIGAGTLKILESILVSKSEVYVRMEPWSKKQKAYADEFQSPYGIEVRGRVYPLVDAPVKMVVSDGSSIRCVVYPLTTKIEKLENQLRSTLARPSGRNDTGFDGNGLL